MSKKIKEFPDKILWVDLEMTGLDPKKQRIIEIAAIVTDFKLKELGRFERIVHQSGRVLRKAEAWPKANMKQLFLEVEESAFSEKEVIVEFADFIREHFGTEPAVMAGNSIHQDRRFIRARWEEVEERLHYRMLDVSTLKIWLGGTKQKSFAKKESHRALDDILESIAELKWSLKELEK